VALESSFCLEVNKGPGLGEDRVSFSTGLDVDSPAGRGPVTAVERLCFAAPYCAGVSHRNP